ncbi:glycine-rich domain-containing protein [Nocardia sp. NPDC059764]|uniref:glycine-rich domain-containing protein n=1 Tax=Nocardia sp. NPDC059764 TaxID=3346939 RepID=UPI00365E18DE
MLLNRSRRPSIEQVNQVVDALEIPEAVFKTCPWQPRELVETGLRQWLRCCGAAMRDDRVIGMPSHAVDEAWHGLILCTKRYARLCDDAFGRFLHHFPDGEGSGSGDPMAEQLGRTVVAWSFVARPGEECVLWNLDSVVGVDHPWGIPTERVHSIEAALRAG